jgi:hypothetical protein
MLQPIKPFVKGTGSLVWILSTLTESASHLVAAAAAVDAQGCLKGC